MHVSFLRLLAAVLCLTALSTGCIINGGGHDHDPEPGDVSVLWSFSGTGTPGRCVDVPSVKKVRLSIPGLTLANAGVSACNNAGVDGVILRNVAPGIYNFTVEALDSADQVLYSGSGSFSVDGNKQVSVTLAPIGQQPVPGDVAFRWSFSGTTVGRCMDVPEVKKVRITIPGQTLANGGLYACTNAGVDGVTLLSFAAGSYNYTVAALDAADQVLYSSSGSFTVNGNRQVNVALDPVGPRPGDITFYWSFSGSTTARQCADVPEVKKVRITIPGQTLANSGIYACTNGGADGITLLSFAADTYNYTVEGLDSANQVLYSSSGSVTVNGNKQVNVSLAPVGPRSGDVSFLWSFSGTSTGRCTDVPDVTKVRITIPGQTLPNGGVYPCTNGGVDGITLQSFPPGTYSYTVEGLDSANQALYSGSGSVTVDGNKQVNVSLTAKSGANSYAYISWTFPPNTLSTNPTCDQAGVSWVDVRIDNGSWTRLDCAQGSGGNRVTTPYVTQGQHTLEFIGVGPDSKHYYYTQATLTTQTGNPVSASYRIEAVGSMALRWELLDGAVARTCAEAGVTTVTIHLLDLTTNTYVYGDAGDSHLCTGAPIIYRYLKPRDYKVYVRGTGSGVFYTNEYNDPPTVTVKAFEQKTDADALTTYLYRQP